VHYNAVIMHWLHQRVHSSSGHERSTSFAATYKIAKSFPRPATSKVRRRSPSPQPPAARHQLTLPDHGYGDSASRGVPVYALQLSLVFTAPTHGGMARLSWSGRLVTHPTTIAGLGEEKKKKNIYLPNWFTHQILLVHAEGVVTTYTWNKIDFCSRKLQHQYFTRRPVALARCGLRSRRYAAICPRVLALYHSSRAD